MPTIRDLPRERLKIGVECLACHDGTLAERVGNAHISSVFCVSESAFPETLKTLNRSLHDLALKAANLAEGKGCDVGFELLPPEDLRAYAETLVKLYTRVVELDGPLPTD